jgi:hypothetical protein
MTVYDFFAGLWRTAVPLIVGFLAVQAARLGIEIDEATVASALTVGFGTVYYALFHRLEQLAPGWGWFLGLARPPHYERPDGELRALSRDGR